MKSSQAAAILVVATTLAALVHPATSDFIAIKWEPCNNSGAENADFWPLRQCLPLRKIQSRIPLATSCDLVPSVAEFTGLDGLVNCTELAAAAGGAYWCATIARRSPIAPVAINAVLANTSQCRDGAAGVTSLYEAAQFVSKPPTDHQVRVQCVNKRLQTTTCDGRTDVPAVISGFPQYEGGQCIAGATFSCENCLPYLEDTSVVQPYYFLLFPALKLVLVVCLKLFVFDQISARVRSRVERFERERPPPPLDDIEEGFVEYMIREVFSDAQRRIRLRLTMRNLDGLWAVKRSLKAYNDNERPLTEDERAKILGPTGLSTQRALLSRNVAVTNYRYAIHETLQGRRMSDDDTKAIRLEEDWFWHNVSKTGERIYSGGMEPLLALFKECWRLHEMPQKHEFSEHGTADDDDDVSVCFKELGHESDPSACEFYVHAEQDEPVDDVISSFEHMLKESDPNYHSGHLVLFHQAGHRVKTYGERVVADIMKERKVDRDAPVLIIRYSLGRRPPKVAPEGRFTPLITQLKTVHDNFITTATFEPARFDREALARETRVHLAKILDRRLNSVVCEQLLLLTGEEVVFDYELDDRYKLRDGIPQVARGKHAKGAHKAPVKHVDDDDKDDEGDDGGEASSSSDDDDTPDELPCFEWLFAIDPDEVAESPMSPVRPTTSTEPIHEEDEDGGGSLQPAASMTFTTTSNPPPRLVVPVAMPEVKLHTISRAALHREESMLTHGVQKTKARALYNRAFTILASRKDYRGKEHEGVMKAFKRDVPKLMRTLSEMYSIIEGKLVEANNDINMVFVRGIAEGFKEKVDSYSRIVPVVTKEQQVFETLYSINVYILLVQVIYAIVFFGFCCRDGITLARPGASKWEKYEIIYFRFLNSGTPASVLAASLANIASGGANRANSYFFAVMDYLLLTISVLLIAPPACTHLIPGLGLYIWIFFAAVFVFASPSIVLYRIFRRYHELWVDPTKYDRDEIKDNHQLLRVILTTLGLWFQFCMMVLTTGLFQSTFNWAHLFYRRSEYEVDYGGVLEYEWESRSPECYFEEALGSTSNVLQFLSSFIG